MPYSDDTQLYLSLSPDTATNQTDAVIAMERCISDIAYVDAYG